MDNVNSRPQLDLPKIPDDFESTVGTSKTDLVKAIFALLSTASITGTDAGGPAPYDLAAIVSQLEDAQTKLADLVSRKPKRIFMNGVSNGVVTVPFDDLGTTDYQVDVAFVGPNINFPTIQWAIIQGSKASNQVRLRVDGDAGAYDLEITITPMTGL